MDFGKLFNVDRVDFSLPKLDARSSFRKSPGQPTSLYYGAPVWSCPAWKGDLYPRKQGGHHELFYYSQFFNSIELNATFYRTPDLGSISKWCAELQPGFKFCPKMSKAISHSTAGDGALRERILHDVRLLSEFGEFLGPCFLQLPDWVSAQEWGRIQQLMDAFPRDFRLGIEFRHPSWFESRRLIPRAFDGLAHRGAIALVTDVAGRRDVSHASMTTDVAMVRFVGNALHSSDTQRIEAWAERLKQWQASGVKEIYFFIHEPDSILVPEATRYFLEAMGVSAPRAPLEREPRQLSLI